MLEKYMDLTTITLPKWPQMIVTGRNVSEEQAKDIIFRTDYFLTDSYKYAGGNEHSFNKSYRKDSKLDTLSDYQNRLLRTSINFVHAQYVINDWASSAFINGPHGWCSPTGEILFLDNVGKWPTVKAILYDWTLIAEAFPYLELYATIMNNESMSAPSPLVNIRVINGNATLEQPDLTVHGNLQSRTHSPLSFLTGELGLPSSWYDEFASKIRQIILTF